MTSAGAPKLEVISVRQLATVASDTEAGRYGTEIPPVSVHRARAWAANPHADPDDPALIMARADDHCVGYLGLFRGLCRCGDGVHPINWLSTWYVPAKYRTLGVGALLLLKLSELPGDIVVTGVSKAAARVYLAAGFREFGPLQYCVVDALGRDLSGGPARALRWLARKGWGQSVAERLTPAVRATRALSTRQVWRRLARSYSLPSSVRTVPTDALAEEAWSANPPGYRFERPPCTIRWMLEHPWTTTRREDQTLGFRFCDFDPEFKYCLHTVTDSATAHRSQIILRRASRNMNRLLAVLDYGVDTSVDAIVATSLGEALRDPPDRLLLPQECWGLLQRSPIGRDRTTLRPRRYFCRLSPDSPLREHLEKMQLSLTDGDFPFA